MKLHEGTIMAKITPKVIENFDNPDESIESLFKYYQELFSKGDKLIIIWATGNSDHILKYQGQKHWEDNVSWARYSAYTCASEEGEGDPGNFNAGPFWIIRKDPLNYHQIANIIKKIRYFGNKKGFSNLEVIEYFDSGVEFCECEFKNSRHPEMMDQEWTDVRSVLHPDNYQYAAFPEGIPAGTATSDFLALQTQAYCEDLGMDGVYLGNAFGTRGVWHPQNAPGYSSEEAERILYFFKKMKETLAEKEVYWMDSYWPVQVEHDQWSVPREAYEYMDGIVVSAWSVILKKPDQLESNLISKLALKHPQIFYQVDFVDPWYMYNAYSFLKERYQKNVELFFKYFDQVDGLKIVANDEHGRFVPKLEIKKLLPAWEKE